MAYDDQVKTAFCPGPGMGLYQFCCMPFGLTSAPASFQRLMDSVLRGLPFATTYTDDVLVFSSRVFSSKLTCALSLAVLAPAHILQAIRPCASVNLGSGCVRLVITFVKMDKMHQ